MAAKIPPSKKSAAYASDALPTSDTASLVDMQPTSDAASLVAALPTSDAAARDAITSNLDKTLFVQAGAGTGKTTALVGRILSLIASGVEVQHIAAITFTEKAAAELQARIRQKLQEEISSNTQQGWADGGGAERSEMPQGATSSQKLHLYETALEDLDTAAISTLHAFAQRILTEYALEANLPLQFEVFDPIAGEIHFQNDWEQFLADSVQNHSLAFQIASTMGIQANWLKEVASSFRDNWDLLSDYEGKVLPDLGNISHDPDEQTDDNRLAVVGYLEILLAQFTLTGVARRKAQGNLIFHDLLVLARDLLASGGQPVLNSLHNRYCYLLIDEFQDTDPIQIDLAVRIASAVQGGEQQSVETTANLPDRWQDRDVRAGRLFFVGDPKQSIYRFRRADISLYLEAVERYGPPLDLTANWRSTEPIIAWVNHVFGKLISPAGRSQSSYEPLEAMREPIAGDPGPSIALIGSVAHKRTTDFDEDGNPKRYKSDNKKKGIKKGAVRTKKQSMSHIREAEAHDIACLIQQILRDEWLVAQKISDDEISRPARHEDICILIPNRTGLDILENALSRASIAYRVEVSNQVFSSPEIRDLIALLSAIEDPTDEQMVVTALRSSAFGCGDDDLYVFRRAGGRWNYLSWQKSEGGVSAEHLVGKAFLWLCETHLQRNLLTPSQLVEKVIRERNLLELALADKDYRDIWRRLRLVGDLAREFTDQTGGTLRQFLQWLRRLGENKVQLDEVIVPESDYNAVRIMTVHAAKGLEFPIVILADMASKMAGRKRPGNVIWDEDGRPGIYFKQDRSSKVNLASKVYTDYFDTHEAFMHHENLRKLYVACTRAKDHLVVSLHRNEDDNPADTEDKLPKTWAETLYSVLPPGDSQAFDFASAHNISKNPDISDNPDISEDQDSTTTEPNRENSLTEHESWLNERESWSNEHQTILHKAKRQLSYSASAISKLADSTSEDSDSFKEPEADEQRGSHIGRASTDFGKAVHAVLQSCDLASLNPDSPNTQETLQKLAEAQAESFGVTNNKDLAEVCRLAEMALKTDIIREVSTRDHLKEIYVAAPIANGDLASDTVRASDIDLSSDILQNNSGENLIYGYIDLTFQDESGELVIIDYKTVAKISTFEENLDKHYRQMATYALALAESTGRPVNRCFLVVLPRDGDSAQEYEIPRKQLKDAKEKVKQVLAVQ